MQARSPSAALHYRKPGIVLSSPSTAKGLADPDRNDPQHNPPASVKETCGTGHTRKPSPGDRACPKKHGTRRNSQRERNKRQLLDDMTQGTEKRYSDNLDVRSLSGTSRSGTQQSV